MDERARLSLLFASTQNDRRDTLVKRLRLKDCDSILTVFEYDRLKEIESSFCPLFAEGIKCHSMEYLNCYFCACPHYIVDDSTYICSINSRFAKYVENILDCSECKVPHKRGFVKKMLKNSTKKLIDLN